MLKTIVTLVFLAIMGVGCVSVPSNKEEQSKMLDERYNDIEKDYRAKRINEQEMIEKKVEAYELFTQRLRMNIE